MTDSNLRYHRCDPYEAWWEYDARGIPLCKVCDTCREAKLSIYRPEVLTNSNYECDEEIDEEPGIGGYDDEYYPDPPYQP